MGMFLSPQDFPRAAPLGNPLSSWTYFTVYPYSCPNTDTIYNNVHHEKGKERHSSLGGAGVETKYTHTNSIQVHNKTVHRYTTK